MLTKLRRRLRTVGGDAIAYASSIRDCIEASWKQEVDVAAALVYESASILGLPIFVFAAPCASLDELPSLKVETPLCVAQR